MFDFVPQVLLVKLRPYFEHTQIQNFTQLLEIKRDFKEVKAKRRRRAEDDTSMREMSLTIQHISTNDDKTVKKSEKEIVWACAKDGRDKSYTETFVVVNFW